MIAAVSVEALALSRGERTLFRTLDFNLAAGEAVALTGANGAGKTSLIRAIAGFLRPDAGAITFRDTAGDLIEAEEARGRQIHLLGHLDGLKGGRLAGDELDFQSRWLGHSDAGIIEAIELLGLKSLLDLEVRKLSAGQRRRFALARLIGSPRALWLLDEPLSPLDTHWRQAVGAIMARHLAGGGMILAAVHDPLPIPARGLELGGGR